MTLSEKIKQRRKELDYTLKYVANKMGVSEATAQRWESGNIANMRHSRISKLADVLKTTPSYLMGWDESISITDKEKRLAEKYLKLKNSIDPKDRSIADVIDKLLGINE